MGSGSDHKSLAVSAGKEEIEKARMAQRVRSIEELVNLDADVPRALLKGDVFGKYRNIVLDRHPNGGGWVERSDAIKVDPSAYLSSDCVVFDDAVSIGPNVHLTDTVVWGVVNIEGCTANARISDSLIGGRYVHIGRNVSIIDSEVTGIVRVGENTIVTRSRIQGPSLLKLRSEHQRSALNIGLGRILIGNRNKIQGSVISSNCSDIETAQGLAIMSSDVSMPELGAVGIKLQDGLYHDKIESGKKGRLQEREAGLLKNRSIFMHDTFDFSQYPGAQT